MGHAFAEISFTPSVKAAQARYGSRESNQRFEVSSNRMDRLTESEREFIETRDSFYQATASETGWPYVQFRGGPQGFLKVIDAATIGFADFQGNRQYQSVGNINSDGRVALILMDYVNQRRLKILGRARIVHEEEDPGSVSLLRIAGYKAKVERAIIISIEAFDWNCPQHITRRFTEAEVQRAIEPLLKELEELRRRVGSNRSESSGQGQD